MAGDGVEEAVAMSQGALVVRAGGPSDVAIVARQFFALWPDGPFAEHEAEATAILSGSPPSTLPLVVLVAELDGAVVGFVEVGLRSHADGCDAERAVGFIEGWYVEPEHRRRGVGRALVQAAEAWARSRGCREMGSDALVDNDASLLAHEALGFEVVDRCVHFKKRL
ncbi:MAG TPA: GNAT family N-acetyltransferase [Polyangiaceae bacterium]